MAWSSASDTEGGASSAFFPPLANSKHIMFLLTSFMELVDQPPQSSSDSQSQGFRSSRVCHRENLPAPRRSSQRGKGGVGRGGFMGPRRSGRLVGSVVKETKIVEETVKVVADVDDLASLEPSAISAGIIREIPVIEIKESKTPQKKVEPKAAPFPLEKKQKGIEAKEVEEKEQKGRVDQKKERKPQELNRRRKRLRRNEEGGVGAYRSYVYKAGSP
ncbi:hypothetical protein EJ110_NYTH59261 [Nymphaea thermarum]|nr:hypothetical protein EJ110_NYTH59261 [Nymphaea thermarum]